MSVVSGRFASVVFCLLLGFAMENAMASWAATTDDRLQAESPIIIYGQYLGDSIISLKNTKYNLGVLKVSRILKGQPSSSIVFLKNPDPELPLRSDMIFFKPGQTGLWFLKPAPGFDGIYQITHPAQFKAAPETGKIVNYWEHRLSTQ